MMCFGLKDRKRLKTNHCVIVLLDDTQLVHELHASSTGQDLLDVVIKHLNLLETSYFGLRFFPNHCGSSQSAGSSSSSKQSLVWLDVEQSAIKQLRNVQPMTVYFAVKYYAPDPCKLAEEITRYQFFLQCKQDILHGRLPIPYELTIELFALAVQSELGDYDPARHPQGYVGEIQFLPSDQSFELERRVALFHRQLTGQVPATAEMNFLGRVKWLDLYGSDLHPIQYDEDNSGGYYKSSGPIMKQQQQQQQQHEEDEYALGLNPSGVSVLRNKLKVAHYVWTRIVKTKCQGRCFLMDVMGNLAAAGNLSGDDNNRTSSSSSRTTTTTSEERQRFGFRLADKEASRRLRLSLEQHKSFYHLINNSATLNQLASATLQRQKFSQRFRHSIRSAIQLGSSAGSQSLMMHQLALQHQQQFQLQQQHQQQHQQQQQRLQLRSSMKSQSYESRQASTVVRMPSRRYSNNRQQPPPPPSAAAATTNGLPSSSGGIHQHAHSMLDHQRQQALMMMNQLNQNQSSSSSMIGKSQTLKPISSKQVAANREKNQYYHQMMMAMMANQQQQHNSVLAPGRHVLHQQPNIYKATSVINGINQLGGAATKESTMMQQLFNTRPQYPQSQRAGHESPRSTKSAIAPSSALKLASKKLAKQKPQLCQYQATDIEPLLAFDPMQQQQMYSNYYGVSAAYNSANVSPRSARSARLTNSRHKSKSTNENLHLLHNNNTLDNGAANFMQPPPANGSSSINNKMLLATATQLMQQQQQLMQRPPPPNYNGNIRSEPKYSDNEREFSKMSNGGKRQETDNNLRKRATFALTNEQANILLSAQSELSAAKSGKKRHPIIEDDYYCCSRSDCSSLEDQQQHQQPQRRGQQQQTTKLMADHRDWNSIRRRHENFSKGKGSAFQLVSQETEARDANNNNAQSQFVKNIANKQATPILLSMNFNEQQQPGATNNNKAVQLLNLQRQQLNSSSSTGSSGGQSNSSESVQAAAKLQSCSGSASSSLTSSPKQQQQQQQQSRITTTTNTKTKADSTVSNSTTTSGYYAGSNSTGSASADSDSQQSSSRAREVAGSRAKIALGSYHSIQSRMSGDRLLIGNQAHLKATGQQQQQQQSMNMNSLRQRDGQQQPQKQQFYLGDPATNNSSESKPIIDDERENWQQPSSLKYVSFDV